jgi:outer membrane protein
MIGSATSHFSLDPTKTYTLSELVDVAEQHNPDTRVAWEQAKGQAAATGVARSALFPVLAAKAMGASVKQDVLFNSQWYQQTLGLFQSAIALSYTIFDFNARAEVLAQAKALLGAQNFNFNNTHLQIIYRVTKAYYEVLNAAGQLDAAQANLQNASAVQQAAEARLTNGLATLPDVLEARSATAQANYELVNAKGNQLIGLGNLATALGAFPTSDIRVQPIDQVSLPGPLNKTVEDAIVQTLRSRPDLLSAAERIAAARDSVSQAKSAFLPTLSFAGDIGRSRAYGEQLPLAGVYAAGETWDAGLSLQWNLFEGGRRRSELARARAEQSQAQAELDALQDDAENEVWTAYVTVKTAYAQQQAAAALLEASTASYDAAVEAYNSGVRNILDVVSAQRALAQARSEDVTARTQLLRQTATLAFSTGDLLKMARHP